MGHKFSLSPGCADIAQRLREGLTEQDAEKLWAEVDTSKDDVLDRKEAKQLYQSMNDAAVKYLEESLGDCHSEKEKKQKEKIAALKAARNDDKKMDMFLDHFDLNQDGKVEKAEFMKTVTQSTSMYLEGLTRDKVTCGLSAKGCKEGEALHNAMDRDIFNIVWGNDNRVTLESASSPGLYISVGPEEVLSSPYDPKIPSCRAVLAKPEPHPNTHHFTFSLECDPGPGHLMLKFESDYLPEHYLSHANGKAIVRRFYTADELEVYWAIKEEDPVLEAEKRAAKKRKMDAALEGCGGAI